MATRWPSSPPGEDPLRAPAATLGMELAEGLAGLVAGYRRAALLADGELRQALEALAAAKWAQREGLRASGVPGSATGESSAPALPPPDPPRWGVLLGKLFEAERGLGRTAEQLARLAPPGALSGVAMARLAGEMARDRAVVRRLYLRYS